MYYVVGLFMAMMNKFAPELAMRGRASVLSAIMSTHTDGMFAKFAVLRKANVFMSTMTSDERVRVMSMIGWKIE